MYEWTKFKEEAGVVRGSSAVVWLAKLSALGINVDKAFPASKAAVELAEKLMQTPVPNIIDIDKLKVTLQAELGRGEIGMEDVVERLAEASRCATVRDDAKEVIGRSQHYAYNAVVRAVSLPDDELVALLRPIIASIVDDFMVAVANIPADVHTEDEANHLGRSTQRAWMDCEEILEKLDSLYALTHEWRFNGILSVNGKEHESNYRPEDFQWEDVATMDSPLYRGSAGAEREHRISWFRRNVSHGPTLLTVEEVDTYRAHRSAGADTQLANA